MTAARVLSTVAAGTLLATTTACRGLFRGEEFTLEVSGAFATPVAAELIAGADLVVAWGCALSPLDAKVTGGGAAWWLAPAAGT